MLFRSLPDSYNLVLNTDHAAIKKILKDEDAACGDELKPIASELKGLQARLNALRDSQSGKKDEEIPVQEKEDLKKTEQDIEAEQAKKETILADYATTNPAIGQLVDLALLSNGLLKGEALSKFIKRSVDMI